MLYPGNVGKNLFEPLDDYIDINSPLWVGMKDVVESFAYKGKHYKFPHKITTSFALNYSKKTIEEYDINGETNVEKIAGYTSLTVAEIKSLMT